MLVYFSIGPIFCRVTEALKQPPTGHRSVVASPCFLCRQEPGCHHGPAGPTSRADLRQADLSLVLSADPLNATWMVVQNPMFPLSSMNPLERVPTPSPPPNRTPAPTHSTAYRRPAVNSEGSLSLPPKPRFPHIYHLSDTSCGAAATAL